jgi:hypothetical protein
VDAAEPPRIVFENPERCADAASAEDLLRRGLVRARAPGSSWSVTMHIEASQGNRHGLSAQGDIVDGQGANVAHRFLSGSSTSCSALARALGVWASLVLEAELSRASDPSSPPAPAPSPPPAPEAVPALDASPEHDNLPTHEEPKPLEVGVGGFVMAETSGRPFAGVTPFVVIDTGHGLFLRPAAAFGESLPQTGSDAQWFAARVDACTRWQGLYTTGHGLELTACLGADGGLTHDSSAPGAAEKAFVAFGPSVDLRGDIVENLSAVLRGVGGADVLPGGFSGRFELALAWRMP